MDEFIYKRKENYFWEFTLVKIIRKPVLLLKRTRITPNMITIINCIVNIPLCCLAVWFKNFYLVALFVQIYCIFDVLDGNLARNKKLTSALGKKLDEISDFIFYTCFYIYLGWRLDVLFLGVLQVIIQHIYGLVATYYIVPIIKKNPEFKRTRLKQFFYDRGILFGMDATLEALITTCFLVLPVRKYFFIINICFWVLDIVYRCIEVTKNERGETE